MVRKGPSGAQKRDATRRAGRREADAKRMAEVAAQKAAFLAAYRRIGTVYPACVELGMCSSTVYDWIRADLEFARGYKNAKDDVADVLEAAQMDYALGRRDATGPQVTSNIFMLKGKRPDIYRERASVEVTGKDGGAIEVKTIEIVKDHGKSE